MTALDSALPQPHQPSRIPLWVKLAYTAFMCILVPIYLRDYGPTNFLYYCDVALLMTLVAIWREDSLWASVPAVGILLPQAFWMADFLGRSIGLPVCGMTEYMFDPNIPLFTRGLSFFHFWLPLFLIWILWRLGYDRRAVRVWTVVAWGLMPVCYFCMPGPSKSLGKLGVPVNINYVYGLSSTEPQIWMPPLVYLGLLFVVLPLGVYLPTHLILRSVFRPCQPLTDGAETVDAATKRFQERRFQFALGGLLVLIVVAGAGYGWLNSQLRPWMFLQSIEAARGEVQFDEQRPGKPLQMVGLYGGRFTDDWLKQVARFKQLRELQLQSTEVTDDGLKHLQEFTELRTLVLNSYRLTDAGLANIEGLSQLQSLALLETKVTDAGLAHFRGLTRLQLLYMPFPLITDAGLEHLRGLTQLRELYLEHAQITDAGLVNLKDLVQLRELCLQGTRVTDAGLEHLEGLSRLRVLWLASTSVTPTGIAKLKTALPNAEISLSDFRARKTNRRGWSALDQEE